MTEEEYYRETIRLERQKAASEKVRFWTHMVVSSIVTIIVTYFGVLWADMAEPGTGGTDNSATVQSTGRPAYEQEILERLDRLERQLTQVGTRKESEKVSPLPGSASPNKFEDKIITAPETTTPPADTVDTGAAQDSVEKSTRWTNVFARNWVKSSSFLGSRNYILPVGEDLSIDVTSITSGRVEVILKDRTATIICETQIEEGESIYIESGELIYRITYLGAERTGYLPSKGAYFTADRYVDGEMDFELCNVNEDK